MGFCGAVFYSVLGPQSSASCDSGESVHSTPTHVENSSNSSDEGVFGVSNPHEMAIQPHYGIHPVNNVYSAHTGGTNAPLPSYYSPHYTPHYVTAHPTSHLMPHHAHTSFPSEGLFTAASAVVTALAGPLGGLTMQMASQMLAQQGGHSRNTNPGLGGEILSFLETMNSNSPNPTGSPPGTTTSTTSTPTTVAPSSFGPGSEGGNFPGASNAAPGPGGRPVPPDFNGPNGPSGSTRFLIQLAFGGVVGYSTGYTVKVIGRFSVIVFGVGLVGYHAAKAYGYIQDDDVDKLRNISDSFGLRRLIEVLDVDKDGKVGFNDIFYFLKKMYSATDAYRSAPATLGFITMFIIGVRRA